ncbi:MAG: carboxypeptidase regulatory-like domain-containing protein, partial [Acidobacteriaceae bacterium]
MSKSYRSASHRRLNCRQSNPKHFPALEIRALAVCVMLIAFGTVARSQTATGQFNGHVFDQSGAVVPGATVTLLNMQSNLVRTVQVNREGLYLFPLLPPGIYKITATQAGFEAATSQQLELDVNQTSTEDFHLQVGTASQTVTVTSAAELLQASSSELGAVVEERTVNELPLNGRNFTALLTLAPGVNPVNYSQNNTFNLYAAPVGLPGSSFVYPSVQGQWNRENSYFADGIVNTASNRGSYDVPPVVDSIQEFKIQSHNDVAEFGSVLGGVVNIVTKSGTNSFHGAAWEYLRNNAFDSRNPFTDFNGDTPAAPAPFRQNQFGADFGGPVRIPKVYNGTNRTFFYFDWESWRYSKAAGESYISPTAAEINGDFTNASVVTSSGVPALLYNPFETTGTAGNYMRPLLGDGLHVPANMINAADQAFIQAYSDKPNFTATTPGGNNTILNAVGVNNANQFSGRVDQNFGTNNTLFFRYSLISQTITSPTSQHLLSFQDTAPRNLGGGYTHVFRPTLILDARVGFSGRFDQTAGSAAIGDLSKVGFPVEPTYGGTSFAYAVSSAVGQGGLASAYNGVSDLGKSSNAGVATDDNYAVNMTWIHGKHQVRFGFQQLIFGQVLGPVSENFGSAGFNFTPAETSNPQNSGSTGNSLASALIGMPDSGRFFLPSTAGNRFISSAAYVQDSFRMTPRLTLNAGLRWDGQSSPHLLNGTTAGEVDPNTFNWIISGKKLPPPCNPTAGVYAPCIPSADPATNAILAAHVTLAPNPNLGPDPAYRNFGPRLGFAYKLDNSTVVRGGYGLIYDTTQGSVQSINDRQLAWPSNFTLPLVFNSIGQPNDTMDAIIPTLSSPKALPAVSTPFNLLAWNYDPHMKPAYSHQFNLDIQKQIGSSLVASVSYIGSVDGRLQITGLANNSATPGDAGVNRPFPWSGTAIMATARGRNNFNALEVRAEKRLASGLAFGSGWTWSKSLDNGAGGFYDVENGVQGYSAVQNYNNLSANYGVSGSNIKHIVYAWGLYELPFGKGKPYLNQGVTSYV